MQFAVTINPEHDSAFRLSVDQCLSAGSTTVATLQRCLRVEYPDALVTNGIIDRGIERWYAYRDGHWVMPIERADDEGF